MLRGLGRSSMGGRSIFNFGKSTAKLIDKDTKSTVTFQDVACLREAQVPFLLMSRSGFVEMFVGVGASRVRDLFKQVKEKVRSSIFIDEIDVDGRSHSKVNAVYANDERQNTIIELETIST